MESVPEVPVPPTAKWVVVVVPSDQTTVQGPCPVRSAWMVWDCPLQIVAASALLTVAVASVHNGSPPAKLLKPLKPIPVVEVVEAELTEGAVQVPLLSLRRMKLSGFAGPCKSLGFRKARVISMVSIAQSKAKT